MSTSQLRAAIAHYRAQLRAREAQAEQILNAAHAQTLKAIQPALDKLYRDIAAKQAAGEEIPLSWLYEQNRLNTIKRYVSGSINHYGALAQMTTGQIQHQAVALGQQAAQAMLQASVPAGVKYAFGVPSPLAIANIIGVSQDGSPLADLFAGFGSEAADGAAQALITGLTLGDGPREVARGVQDALGVSRNRALVIAQDQMVNAYRLANGETFRANADVLDGWVWSANLGGACLACVEMNGSVHPVDEDMESHVRCECVPVPLTKSWADILGGDLGIDTSDLEDISLNIEDGATWLAKQDAATQLQVLGSNARYDLYQSGVPLKAMVTHTHDPKWGGSIGIKPLKELVKK